MKNILITGNVKKINSKLLEALSEYYALIVTGISDQKKYKGRVRVFETTPLDEKFSWLFEAYSFQTVIYLSSFTEQEIPAVGEIRKLEETLRNCSHSDVEKVILISTAESMNFVPIFGEYGTYLKREYFSSAALEARHVEELCEYYVRKEKIKIVTLQCPYIIDVENNRNFLWRLFDEAYSKKRKILLPNTPKDRVDFLTIEDLTKLLINIAEEKEDESSFYYAGSGRVTYFENLEEKLKELIPGISVEYRKNPVTAAYPEYPRELRRIYGFVPKGDVIEELEQYYRLYNLERLREAQKKSSDRNLLISIIKKLLPYIELILLFLFNEWLNQRIGASVYFKIIDLRLILVVTMATIYGMRMGIVAALMECLAVGNAYRQQGADFEQIFYNIENWLPFVFYLMAGTVTGYVKKQKNDELDFLNRENRLIREKYTFLNRAYQGALENKGEYKRQILGFQDSFGKIFSAVQRLDHMLPESVYLEGVKILEDILQNHTVAIYSLDKWQKFGRLSVCSYSMLQKLQKSILIEDYKPLYDSVCAGEVWKNTQLRPGLPMYAYGIFQNKIIKLLVVIYEADLQQMGRNYMNIFQILCGLMQTSFLRALEYEKWTEQITYYADTNIVKPERFRELCRIQEDIRQAGFADYLLVKFEEKDKRQLSEKVSAIVRSSDTLGADEKGNLYVLLAQVNRENFRYVQERFDKVNLKYQIVDKIGEMV